MSADDTTPPENGLPAGDLPNPPTPTPQGADLWERVARAGSATLVSVGVIAVWMALVILGRAYPPDFKVAYYAALGYLFGAGLLKVLGK